MNVLYINIIVPLDIDVRICLVHSGKNERKSISNAKKRMFVSLGTDVSERETVELDIKWILSLKRVWVR